MIRDEIVDKFNYKGDPKQKKNNNKKNKDEIWLKNKKTGPFPFWRECMQKPRIKETK